LQLAISLPRNRIITAEDILHSKRRWIEKKINELSRIRKTFKNSSMLYLGNYVRVEYRLGEKSCAELHPTKKTIIIQGNGTQKNDSLLFDFISSQTLSLVNKQAAEFAKTLGVTCAGISTRETKSWGYCTRQGKLFFNWRLICLPPRLIDFIVFHELLHLKHFNHSKQFRNILSRYFSDHKELEATLKTYSAQ
jgi:predicted metal-dependent hydrolase